MASFSADFTVGTFSTAVNYVHMDINQAVDTLGRPASLTRGGKLTVEFNATANNVVAVWMANPAKKMDGSIVFKQMGVNLALKEIQFTNAYCVELTERFDGSTSTAQMVTIITISPETITVGGVLLDNRWPATESTD
jgi:hypothetical protein